MKFYILGSLLVVFFLFLIFLFSLFHYRKYLKNKKIKGLWLLLLRSISLSILLILLIEPLFFYIKAEPQKYNLNIYIDNSKSMNFGIDRDSLKHHIDNILKWGNSKNYSSHFFTFGNSFQETGFFDFTEEQTNYSAVASDINNKTNDLNIIITDGNSTHGYNLSDIEFNSAINILGVGKPKQENTKIKNVSMQPFIARGDSLEIIVEIESVLDSDLNKYLSVWNDDLLLISNKISLMKGQNIYREKIIIPTNNLTNEAALDILLADNNSKSNDSKNKYYKTKVLILDSDNQILLLTGSVSPNTQFIKNILSEIPNSSTAHVYKTNNNWELSIDELEVGSKNLIVYDNFPVDVSDYKLFDQVQDLRNNKSKILYFEGPSYDFNTINKIRLNDKKISMKKGVVKNNFLSNNFQIKNLPPINRNILISSNGFDKVHLEYSDSTISIGEANKDMYFFIPDLSYLMINENSHSFNKYIQDIIRLFLDSGKNLLINSNKREIIKGEKIILYSSYLDVYDTLKSSVIIKDLKNRQENEVNINKLKIDQFNNRYIDDLDIGSYELSLKMSSSLNTYKSNNLKIDIIENNLEDKVNFRNEKEMKMLALTTNGNYYPLESVKSIKPLIKNHKNILQKKVELNIHSFHKFWFILLITLIIEWFFRKRKGLL